MQQEKVAIVDKKDNIIGYKFRDKIDYAVDIYRSTAIWITNSKGDVLVAQRSFNKANCPGKWGPAAAGTVAGGETYESNAYKELKEEIGLEGLALREGKARFFDDGKYMQFSKWYFGTIDIDISELTLQESEVAAVKWISFEELAEDLEKNPDSYVFMMPAGLEVLKKRSR